MTQHPAGSHGSTYRERLVPGPLWWLVVAALVAMVAIAYGAALGAEIGFVVGGGLAVIAVVALVRGSTVVEVDSTGLRCGRARLPRLDIGTVSVLDGEQVARIRRGQDPKVGDRVYHVVPPWLASSGVVVAVIDDADPHAAWLIASRRPQRLLSALATPVAE